MLFRIFFAGRMFFVVFLHFFCGSYVFVFFVFALYFCMFLYLVCFCIFIIEKYKKSHLYLFFI